MTIMGAISHVDSIKPNRYTQVEKIRWLSTLDGLVKREIIDTHEGGEDVVYEGYDDVSALTKELLVPAPYDAIYFRWLEAQIDYANGEYGKYNNSISAFNDVYTAYSKYYNREHKPIARNYTHF
jgi:hypothetical protein